MKNILFVILLLMPLSANADENEVRSFVKKISGDAVKIASGSGSFSTKQKKLNKIFAASVDFDWIAKFVAGKHWKNADSKTRASYKNAYKQFLTNSYTSRFKEYSGEKIEIVQVVKKGKSKSRYIVSTAIKRPGAADIIVDFRVRNNSGKYYIYDIIVEGISLLTSQRTDFGAVIESKGMKGLIKDLKEKNKQIS